MRVYVMPYDEEKWGVKTETSKDFIAVNDTKEEALEAAKEVAIGSDAELIILRKDGTIDNLGLYGVDPFPSEDNAPEFNNEQDEGI